MSAAAAVLFVIQFNLSLPLALYIILSVIKPLTDLSMSL